MHNEFLGKNGFIWWIGIVENIMDSTKLGRVKVRIFGWHNMNENELPTEDLQWAQTLQPTTSAAFAGVGQSPTGLRVGSWVMGMFLDGESAQYPMVIGSIPGNHHSQELYNTSQGTRNFFNNQKISFVDSPRQTSMPNKPDPYLTSDKRKPIGSDGKVDNSQYDKKVFNSPSKPSTQNIGKSVRSGKGIMGYKNWNSKYFTAKQLDYDGKHLRMDYASMEMFDRLISELNSKGISLKQSGINGGGYRPPRHYHGGGSKGSSHFHGRAIDFIRPSNKETLEVIKTASSIGFSGIGVGVTGQMRIHIDTGWNNRVGKRYWQYTSSGRAASGAPAYARSTLANHMAGRY